MREKAGETERLSLGVGQGLCFARRTKAAELERVLVKEIEEARRALQ